ncbi:hypothetical protein [Paraburkholderia terrae]|nr:hypothetical protein [Paraburkholderia terrae]
MMSEFKLPEAFADLTDAAAHWAKPTEYQRSTLRWNASKEDFAVLYNTIMPRLDAILSYMESLPVKPVQEEDRNLYWLACAFAEASPHHELYEGSAQVPHSFVAERFVAAHGDVS